MTRSDFESAFTMLMIVAFIGFVFYRDGIGFALFYALILVALLVGVDLVKSALWWLLSKIGKVKP